jgi:hypothetical protein
MTTAIQDIRSGYVDLHLHRTAGGTRPWSDAELEAAIAEVIAKLWPRLGVYTHGDVDADQTTNLYTVPTEFGTSWRISRIDLLDSTGLYRDRISNWRIHDSTQVIVKPLIANGATLRFYGWVPFAADGSDLPDDLASMVGHRASSRAWTNLAGELLNSERQQNLASGRVVSYADAVGLAAAHERTYQDGTIDHPSRVSYAPRAANRR